jgi:hypothetical protein
MAMHEVSMLMHEYGPVIDKDALMGNMDGHA